MESDNAATGSSAMDRFRSDLFSPDADHMPAAYWFWHHKPDEASIRAQIRQIKDAGILSFQIQARLAFPMDQYLDDDYLRACRIAVAEASRLGMTVGIYDDYNWQTGHAAGRAVAGHDELREQHLFFTTAIASETGIVELQVSDIRSGTENLGPAGMAWHYEDSKVYWADWKLVFALAGDNDVTASARITVADVAHCRVEVQTGDLEPGTPVVAFIAARCATSRLINFADRAAVNRFIEVGYEPFYHALGEYFGSTIAYFFFDQPHANFYTWPQRTGNLYASIPYHPGLANEIRDRWPERYPEILRALLFGDGAAQKADRAQFYEYLGHRNRETFLGALHQWTEMHKVDLSGHEVLAHVGHWDLGGAFDDWDLRVNFGLDYFAIDSYRDRTGVDAQDLPSQLSAKLGDSVARANGRSGVILEQYFADAPAGTGSYAGHWGLTLEELRAQTFRHHLLGMRQLLFHGFYQTDGTSDNSDHFTNPRFDFPPGENFEPWFAEYHKDFAIESGRLSTFMDGVRPTCDVAVLYPLRTIWAEGQTGPQAADVGHWSQGLAQQGYGFHLVDENDLQEAAVHGGRIWFGDRGYRTLVMASISTLESSATLGRLRLALAGGVQVIASGETVSAYQNGAQTAVADFASLNGIVYVEANPTATQVGAAVGPSDCTNVSIRVLAGSQPMQWTGATTEELRAVVFNDSAGPSKIRITSPNGPLCRVDLATANVTLLAVGQVAEVVLETQEALVLTAGVQNSVVEQELHPQNWGEPRTLTEPCTLEIDALGDQGQRHSQPIDPALGWQAQGLPGYSGIATYRWSMSATGDRPIQFTAPRVAGSATLVVNEIEIGRRGWSPYRWQIPASALRGGGNDIALRVASTAANKYYAGTEFRSEPEPAGLLATPLVQLAGE